MLLRDFDLSLDARHFQGRPTLPSSMVVFARCPSCECPVLCNAVQVPSLSFKEKNAHPALMLDSPKVHQLSWTTHVWASGCTESDCQSITRFELRPEQADEVPTSDARPILRQFAAKPWSLEQADSETNEHKIGTDLSLPSFFWSGAWV